MLKIIVVTIKTIRRYFSLLFILTPLIPLSFKGEGERLCLQGLCPFKLPLITPSIDYYSIAKLRALFTASAGL